MNEILRLLHLVDQGDPEAAGLLRSRMLGELRHRVQAVGAVDPATQVGSLVHQTYVRLLESAAATRTVPTCGIHQRCQFYRVAAEAMRELLLEKARADLARESRVGRAGPAVSDGAVPPGATPSSSCRGSQARNLLALDRAIERLGLEDAQAAEFVRLRLCAGLAVAEAGELLGLGPVEAARHWDFIRAWFAVHHRDDGCDPAGGGRVV